MIRFFAEVLRRRWWLIATGALIGMSLRMLLGPPEGTGGWKKAEVLQRKGVSGISPDTEPLVRSP